MKKTFLLSLLALVTGVAALAQNPAEYKGYTIRGNVANIKDGETVTLLTDSQAMKFDIDTVKNGTFTLKGHIESPFLTMLLIGNEKNPAAIPVDIFIDNDDMTITGDFLDKKSIVLSGSGLTDKYKEFVADNMKFAARAAQNPAQSQEIQKECMNFSIQTIKDNINNGFGLLLLNGMCYGKINEQIAYLASLIPDEAKNHMYAKMILSKVANTFPELKIGSRYYPAELPDADGKTISTNVLLEANKLILIDFWASWCEPCMKKIPELKSIYERYHKKGFEIYGISIDTDKDSWVGSVKKHKLRWVNVSSLEGDSCPDFIRYGVHKQGIPYYALISNEGVVLYIGNDLNEVQTILGELF